MVTWYVGLALRINSYGGRCIDGVLIMVCVNSVVGG